MEKIRYNRLKDVLDSKGISQYRFAMDLGIAQSSVSEICRNHRQMSMERLFEWAVILDVEPCDLLISVKDYLDEKSKIKGSKK